MDKQNQAGLIGAFLLSRLLDSIPLPVSFFFNAVEKQVISLQGCNISANKKRSLLHFDHKHFEVALNGPTVVNDLIAFLLFGWCEGKYFLEEM